jgi:hypothetical protein
MATRSSGIPASVDGPTARGAHRNEVRSDARAHRDLRHAGVDDQQVEQQLGDQSHGELGPSGERDIHQAFDVHISGKASTMSMLAVPATSMVSSTTARGSSIPIRPTACSVLLT